MSDAPDVLLVVLDSARKARLTPYGHRSDTTPALAALAGTATVYERAHTSTPWTLPSHCSLFTGRFPSEHGVTNGFTDRNLRLPPDVPTLAERLSDAGYATAGFSNNPWVGRLSGLDRGFDEYVEWDLEIGRTTGRDVHGWRGRLYDRGHALLGQAARTPVYLLKRRFFTNALVDRATRWLEATADAAAPTFTFLNLMEAHSPYYPPRAAFRALGFRPPGPVEPRTMNLALLAYVLGRRDLGDRRDRLLEYYDASLRYQDGEFARLLATLRRLGRFDDTLVVVCADHGKNLGEFDRGGSPPHYLRNVNTNVPLVVKRPGQRAAERDETAFELPRIFDLVLAGGVRDVVGGGVDAGREGDGAVADGNALIEDFVPHTARHAESVTRWRALVSDGHKLVTSQDGEEYLLEGTTERDVVVDGEPDVRAALRAALADRVDRLEARRSASEEAAEADLTAGVEAQLEDLGYL